MMKTADLSQLHAPAHARRLDLFFANTSASTRPTTSRARTSAKRMTTSPRVRLDLGADE
jgi:hypothetical protein